MAVEKFVYDVPGLAYLEHQVIQLASQHGDWIAAVRSVEADYEMDEGALGDGSFRQTRMLSLLYCVFVVPRELFGKSDFVTPEIGLAMASWQQALPLDRSAYWENWTAETLITHIRNSVAHADMAFEASGVLFYADRGRSEVEFTMNELETFIAKVGSAIANSMSARRKSELK